MNSSLLSRLIPLVLENTFKLNFSIFYIIKLIRIAIDPLFPPPELAGWSSSKKYLIPDNIIESNRIRINI